MCGPHAAADGQGGLVPRNDEEILVCPVRQPRRAHGCVGDEGEIFVTGRIEDIIAPQPRVVRRDEHVVPDVTPRAQAVAQDAAHQGLEGAHPGGHVRIQAGPDPQAAEGAGVSNHRQPGCQVPVGPVLHSRLRALGLTPRLGRAVQAPAVDQANDEIAPARVCSATERPELGRQERAVLDVHVSFVRTLEERVDTSRVAVERWLIERLLTVRWVDAFGRGQEAAAHAERA
mmetsp:Transcript_8978/g.29749  ORF Transcript_8978/g.29749 Transcript_8978/m.29749 type:complete len:230 (-) Transcript_8978:214-903(-)